MTYQTLKRVAITGLGAAALLLMISAPAHALDAAKDRRGVFWGMGLGGGGALTLPEVDTGGHVLFDIQLGAGVSKNLTLSLDTDVVIMIFDAQKNFIFTPGPELNYFFGDTGLFIRAGVGAAMDIVRIGNDNDFTIGLDSGVGFGWEFFANNNLALGLALEVDYIVRKGRDLMMFGFMFNLKYY